MPDPTGLPTPYPEINALLSELLSAIREVLGAHFVGMYLDGSLAAGGFDSASDIDFVVVTDVDVDDGLFLALQALHERFNRLDSPWAIQLEGSYVSLAGVRRYDPQHARFPNIERGLGERLKIVDHDGWFTLHRHLLRAGGITLAGPPPHTLVDPVSTLQLRRAALQVLDSWAAHFSDRPEVLDFGGYQCYVVLTVCRILYTLQSGGVASKQISAEWAREALGMPWRELVERALVGRLQPRQKADAADIRASLDFIRFAQQASQPVRSFLHCEICSQLEDVETSFSKYGWPEMDRPLPPSAARLEVVEALTDYDPENHHIRRCRLCATRYQYDWSYDYLVNGSEDEERLARLVRLAW